MKNIARTFSAKKILMVTALLLTFTATAKADDIPIGPAPCGSATQVCQLAQIPTDVSETHVFSDAPDGDGLSATIFGLILSILT